MSWVILDDELTNTEFIGLTEKAMMKPYPKALWRTDYELDPAAPSHLLTPEVMNITIQPVAQKPYITIHDAYTEKNDFDNNGLAVLDPISCKETEILNGKWEVQLEHAIDADGKWQYLKEFNLLKVNGQIFTIVYVEHTYYGGKGRVIVRAEHIFYHMQDMRVFPGARIGGVTMKALLNSMMRSVFFINEPGVVNYTFSWDASTDALPEGTQYNWYDSGEKTPTEYILGSNGFITAYGGELYRDNFYFSIFDRMEGAQEDSFDIRIGLNLTGIRRVVDLSSYCSYFRGYDKFGSWFAISWAPLSMPGQFSHKVIRSETFHYDIPGYLITEEHTEADISFERLKADVTAYFSQNSMPTLSYSVNIKDVKNNEDFKEFTNCPRYKVGDTGKVYDERLGIDVTLKVTKTVKDCITGEILEVTFGDLRSFTRTQGYKAYAIPTDANTDVVTDNAFQLRDSSLAWLFDSEGARVMGKDVE